MKCSLCGLGLAESKNGLEAHMRRYHNVTSTLVKSVAPVYKPLDPVVKQNGIKRFESKMKSFIIGGEEGERMYDSFKMIEIRQDLDVKGLEMLSTDEIFSTLHRMMDRTNEELKKIGEAFK